MSSTQTQTSKNDLTTEVVTTTPLVLYCEEEEEEEEEEGGNYGEVEWPRTMVELEVAVQCPFTRDGLPQNATRMCTLNGQSAVWMSPDYSNCITISQGLEILAQENVTTDNFMDVSVELVELTEESERLEEEDVENAVTVFEAVSMNLRGVENETEDVLDNLFVTVNQLLLAGETELMEAQMKAKTSSRIIQAVEETVMSVQIQGEDYTSKSETFDVSIINVNEETRQSDIQFPKEESKKNGNTDDSNNDGDDDDGADDTITKIVIPKEAIKDATRVQFVLYKDTSFFQTITNTEETTTGPPCAEGEEGCLLKSRVLSSFVISASVGNQKISNLENKVTNTFYHVTDDKDQFTNNSQCVFWDFDAVNGRGDWSTDGCTVSATSNTTTTCECDHLTNFAVLLDIYGNAGEIPEDHRLIITYISIAGAGLSFISLVLALASYACAGRLRKDKRVKVLINLMTALLFMNMAFLFDVVVSELGSSHKYLCFGAAVAMHYTLLCVMTWMAVEAFTMYLALVQVFDSKRRRFMLKMCFLGWGLPAVIVGCSVWIDRENYGYENNLCYLKRIPFFISFFVPVCIVMIWNSVVYILVARQMHRLRKRQTKFNQTFSLTDQLRASFSLTFLLGLTWLFAFFAFGELNLTFTYLFAITNTLQGFVVFLLHCVFKREIRRQWQALCCPCIPLLKEGDDGTYSRSKTVMKNVSGSNLKALKTRPNRVPRSEKVNFP
ncbi:putative G-protein coupled receptor [Apostichopus japonicus]|uniref:Putative G-protein coupled receptor n=1 Tax=Stichopus japonicus TaxID=307972 RepID=A0A2G8LN20_STIJA|nr:putative G-protein coupled receptor [Apostichopus japonicus]